MMNDLNEYVEHKRWKHYKLNHFFFLPVNANSSSHSWLCNTDAGIFANIFTDPIQKPQNANTYCWSVNRLEDTEGSVQLQAK